VFSEIRPPDDKIKCSKCPPWVFIQTYRRRVPGTLLSSTTSDWGCLPRFLKSCPSRAAVKCLKTRIYMVHEWWCSTTFSSCVLEILEHCVSEQWMEQRGAAAWSARSPYGKDLEFNLWGYLKPSASAREFIDCQDGSEMIRRTPGVFQAVRQSPFRRANLQRWGSGWVDDCA